MKYPIILLLFCIFDIPIYICAQITIIPNVNKVDYRNEVVYDKDKNSFLFNYYDNESALSYEYSLNEGGSFNGIKVISDNYIFYPSYFGGPSVKSQDNSEYFIWSKGIQRELLNFKISKDTLISNWVMKKEDKFYFHYQFKIYIKGKTLVVNVKDMGSLKNYPVKYYAKIASFQSDRCENTIEPKTIGIPYLSTINILYTQNLFLSVFFDWTKTNSAQIFPLDFDFSATSKHFSQNALYTNRTNNKVNKLNETIYITVSSELEETFPNIPNPISKYKNESMNHIVYDNWDAGFQKIIDNTKLLKTSGLDSLWLIVHNWQNAGYDNKFPDVLPANSKFGGNEALNRLSAICKSFNFLFSLHENYNDFYPNAASYNSCDVAVDNNANPIKAWKTDIIQSYMLKPSKIKKYLIPFSKNIHSIFKTNASFLDVLTARSPSEYIDFDGEITNSGKCAVSYRIICDVGNQLQKIHKGPVSGEGYHHFYYTGYYDDFEAQIQTGQISSQGYTGGYYKPLIVDFDLLKMHDKAMVHGMGYYERFFYNNSNWMQYTGRSKDSALIYSATELAYGHGAFFSSLSYNPVEQASIEKNYVYPVQLLYGNSKPVLILYNDGQELVTISEYIKRHPKTFDQFDSEDFLSQVFVEYDNGVKIFVNRHPTREWSINVPDEKGWYSFHAIINNSKTLYTGNDYSSDKITIPKENGWFVYSPVNPYTR